MKHFYSLLIGLCLVFSGALVAFAQENNEETRPIRVMREAAPALNTNLKERIDTFRGNAEERRNTLQGASEERKAATEERRDTVRSEVEERVAEKQERRTEFQRRAASRVASNFNRIASAHVNRLEKLIERIESRMAKQEVEGIDTAEAGGYITLAKADLASAEADISAFASIDLSSEEAQENFERVRVIASEVKSHIKDARENIRKAIVSLAQSQGSDDTDSEDSSSEESTDQESGEN